MKRTLGLEIELYTGTPKGQVVGRSSDIARRLEGFVCEPDARNTEYITEPYQDVHALRHALLEPRQRLRALLAEMGGLTIVPGSTLPLKGDADHFDRSDPDNAYHARIERAYGTRVVTTSIHFNFGIAEVEPLMRACRLMRMEAPLALALTASSPFLNGEATGAHSTRWRTFPQTPAHVPLFANHAAYVAFVESQLASGTMWNVRHLWCSARPNGPNRPHDLNRLEVRICDLTLDIPLTLAVGLLLMRRIEHALNGLDPLGGRLNEDELLALCEANEQAVALDSLDARVTDWQTGRVRRARDCVVDWLDDIRRQPLAYDERAVLAAVDRTLDHGNDAMRWLAQHARGATIEEIVQGAIQETADAEQRLDVG